MLFYILIIIASSVLTYAETHKAIIHHIKENIPFDVEAIVIKPANKLIVNHPEMKEIIVQLKFKKNF